MKVVFFVRGRFIKCHVLDFWLHREPTRAMGYKLGHANTYLGSVISIMVSPEKFPLDKGFLETKQRYEPLLLSPSSYAMPHGSIETL